MATRWYASKSTKLSVRLVKIFRLVNPIRVLSNGDQTAGRTERWKMPNRNFRSFPVAGRIELGREVPNRGGASCLLHLTRTDRKSRQMARKQTSKKLNKERVKALKREAKAAAKRKQPKRPIP